MELLLPVFVVEKCLNRGKETGAEFLRCEDGSLSARRLAVAAIEAIMDIQEDAR